MEKIIINDKEYKQVRNSITKGLGNNNKSTCKACDIVEESCNAQCGSVAVVLKLITHSEEESITELTIEEVAAKFDKDVKNIRIKD